jgi:prophage DNA circulation protein
MIPAFTIAGQPSFVAVQAAADLAAAVAQLTAIVAGMGAPAAAVYAWQQQADALTAPGDTVFANPTEAAASLAALIGGMSMLFVPSDANGNPTVTGWQQQLNYPSIGMSQTAIASVLAAQLAAAQLQPTGKLPLAVTALGQQMAANRAALYALVTEIALGEAVCAALATQFTSSDQAIATRDQVATLLAAQSLYEADLFHDRVAAALDGARIALVQQIDTVAARLPEVVSVTPPQTVSAVVLAHRLYDDPAGDSDIIARNPDIVHPLFIPGGVALEVLAP